MSEFFHQTFIDIPQNMYYLNKMEEEEGFEPPRALTPLSVFKTDPFSQTWVFLRVLMVDPAGLEPATDRL